MNKTLKGVLPFIIALVLLLTGLLPAFSLASGGFFSDVPKDEVYFPHIQKMYEEKFITGDTISGILTGGFRPYDYINRAELAKMATVMRLAEQFGLKDGWHSMGELEYMEEINNKLKSYYRCNASTCRNIGDRPFEDVAEKEWGCETEGSCEPWYTQYIYYALAKGFVKGYEEDGNYYFKPTEPVLRIHALKMIMADNGNIDPDDDARFQRLEALAGSRSSDYPKCLSGAENYILENNGGNTVDAKRLLSYALLADRLDLFGNTCQIFREKNFSTQNDLADFLQQPLTRREVPRYFAITVDYPPVNPDAESDGTINSGSVQIPVRPPKDTAEEDEDDNDSNDDDGNGEGKEVALAGVPDTLEEKKEIELSSFYPVIVSDSPIRACASFDSDCIVLPPSSEIEEINAGLTGRASDLNYYATIKVDGVVYDIPCDVWKSDLCRIAGWDSPVIATEIVAGIKTSQSKKTGNGPGIPTAVRPDHDLVDEVVRQCRASGEVCSLLEIWLFTYDFPISFFSGCNDDACRAKRILDAFAPRAEEAMRALHRGQQTLRETLAKMRSIIEEILQNPMMEEGEEEEREEEEEEQICNNDNVEKFIKNFIPCGEALSNSGFRVKEPNGFKNCSYAGDKEKTGKWDACYAGIVEGDSYWKAIIDFIGYMMGECNNMKPIEEAVETKKTNRNNAFNPKSEKYQEPDIVNLRDVYDLTHGSGKLTPKYIILHRTASSTAVSAVNAWTPAVYLSKQETPSVHYIIDVNGTIFKLSNDDTIRWHTGRTTLKKDVQQSNAIGIEVVGDHNGVQWEALSNAQLRAISNLTMQLVKKYNIQSGNVCPHEFVSPKTTGEGSLYAPVVIDFLNNNNHSFKKCEKDN